MYEAQEQFSSLVFVSSLAVKHICVFVYVCTCYFVSKWTVHLSSIQSYKIWSEKKEKIRY
jgi:hypothetical protein